MKGAFSADRRTEWLQAMSQGTLDLLVIGGGITGAGIVWDASKRGMRAGLIEKSDFAFGTSSRSTKLIHGGLRYLKKGEVKLVREVGRERELLHRHAPHLVIPAPMLLPIYKDGSFGYRSTSIGLYLYDRLAGVRKPERRVMLKGEEAWRREPILKRGGLIGAGCYYEYRSDDARLTIEVLKTAVRHGVKAVNYAEAVDFLYSGSKLAGVRVTDVLTGEEYELRARKVINAAGPWVDRVRSKDHAVKGKRLLLTKGVHLVVEHRKLPVRQSAYLDVPDGRMIFVIPRDGKTYIGTTDTVYEGDPERPRITVADRDYLLHAVNLAFPEAGLTPDDVESMWAGLRPLIHAEGKKPSDISRKDEVWVSSSGLISIAGGKLTGFRKMAEKAVNLVAEQLEKETRQAFAPCMTDKEVLSGGDSGRADSYDQLREELIKLGIRKGLSLETARYLLGLYGSNTIDIYARMDGVREYYEGVTRDMLKGAHSRSTKADDSANGFAPPDMNTQSAHETTHGKNEQAADGSAPPDMNTHSARETTHGMNGQAPDGTLSDMVQKGSGESPQGTSTAADAAEPAPESCADPIHEPNRPYEHTDVAQASETPEQHALAAEIAYCMEEEMAVTAADFLLRRTGLLYFDRRKAERIALDVLEQMAAALGWGEARLERQRLELAKEWESVTVAVAKD